MSKKSWRLRRIVRPGLQMHLTLTFLGLAALSLVFQYLLFTKVVAGAAANLDIEAGRALEELYAGMMTAVLWSLGVVLPLTLVVGVMVTHRVAGPLHALETWLERLARGEVREAARIRQGDLLQDFCELLNRATRPLWQGQVPPQEEPDAGEGPAPSERAA